MYCVSKMHTEKTKVGNSIFKQYSMTHKYTIHKHIPPNKII